MTPKAFYKQKRSPWLAFLQARAAMIVELQKQRKTFEQIADTLSCDPGQCRLIYESYISEQQKHRN